MMFLQLIKKIMPFALIAGIVLLIAYHFFIRPWMFRMGAANEEVTRAMPGDGMVASPGSKYTQAITINAPKDIVWAYVIQMGYRRGGWYNLDFINRMASKEYFYENNKSADRVIPELQNLKTGDKINVTPQLGFEVVELKKNDYMLMTAKEGDKCLITWVYEISEIDANTSRLRVRWVSNPGDGLILKLLNYFIIDPGGAGIQQRLNMKGIKIRSEADYAKAK